jgi:hypothetical protein
MKDSELDDDNSSPSHTTSKDVWVFTSTPPALCNGSALRLSEHEKDQLNYKS